MAAKLKIYVVTVLAFSPLHDMTSAHGEGTYVEQIPGIILAESKRAAALDARRQAYERWNPEAGWYGHQAAVLPVTRAFYKAAGDALRAGVVDEADDEDGETFTLAEM